MLIKVTSGKGEGSHDPYSHHIWSRIYTGEIKQVIPLNGGSETRRETFLDLKKKYENLGFAVRRIGGCIVEISARTKVKIRNTVMRSYNDIFSADEEYRLYDNQTGELVYQKYGQLHLPFIGTWMRFYTAEEGVNTIFVPHMFLIKVFAFSVVSVARVTIFFSSIKKKISGAVSKRSKAPVS